MATKKTTPKKVSAGKKVSAAKKVSAGKRIPAKKNAESKSPAGRPARKAASKKSTPKKAADQYTDPALRERIKARVMKGDKGGRPEQWSARKAQLVAHEYEAEGGAYTHPRDERQQHLKDWGDEKWHTVTGEPAIHGETTSRYLPDAAWKKLTPAEKKATERKKEQGSKAGKQFVPNTGAAKKARKWSVKSV